MKKLAIALATTMAVFCIFAAVLWNELRSEQRNLAGLESRMSEPEAGPKGLISVVPAIASAASIIGAPADVGSSAQQPEAVLPEAELTTAEKAFERGVADARAQMSAEGLRPQIAQRYPDLAKDLGLSQGEAEKVIDLIAKQQGGITAFLASSEGKSREELWRINNARILADEREQEALLGSRYPQWVAYQGTVSARQMIRELQPLLGSGGDALTDSQFSRLAESMGVEIARITKESQDKAMAAPPPLENSTQSNLQYAAERDRRIVEAASSQLTPAQLNQFRQLMAKKAESRARSAERDEAIKVRVASGARQ